MTHAAAQIIAPSATPQAPARWFTVNEAAGVLGLTASRVRQMCRAGELTARQELSPSGSGEWTIDPDCRPALRIAAGGQLIAAPADDPLSGLTAAKRAVIHRRYQAVRELQAALDARPAALGADEFLRLWAAAWSVRRQMAGEPGVSASTLYNWQRRFRSGGIAGLIDRRRYAGPIAAVGEEAWSAFCGLYLDQAAPHIPRLWERVAALAAGHPGDQQWAWPGLRTIQRWVAQKLPAPLLAAGRDPKRFRDRCLPWISRDWSGVPAMGCWVGDHRQLDVLWPRLVVAEKKGVKSLAWKWYRPWLTGWLDARSWFLPAWDMRFASPDGQQTMGSFIRGVARHGQPEAVYIDNGKDFRMGRFAGGRRGRAGFQPAGQIVAEKHVKPILQMLGIEAYFATPYNAKAKVIEPWFKLMAEWFDKTWPTYCGRSPGHRPERLDKFFRHGGGESAEAYARGVLGEAYSRVMLLADPLDQDRRDELTIGPLKAAFERWLTDDYALRQSPCQWAGGLSAGRAFAELRREGHQVRRPATDTLMLLLMPSVPVCVGPKGVYVRAFGMYYWHQALESRACASGRDLRRKVVYRYDPADSGQIVVYDAQTDRFLCIARPHASNGIPAIVAEGDADNQERLSAAIELQRHMARRYNKEVKGLRQAAGEAVNGLLSSSRSAARALGLLDTGPGAAVVASAAPAPAAQIIYSANHDLASRALARVRADRASEREASQLAALAATGTDGSDAETRRRRDAGIRERQQPLPSSLSLLRGCDDDTEEADGSPSTGREAPFDSRVANCESRIEEAPDGQQPTQHD